MNVTHLLKRCIYAAACSAACAFLALHAQPALAGQGTGNGTAPKIENVGFMKNPPKELREKFPMCDAFLEVEWIDRDKGVGYTRYSIYSNDGTLEIIQVDALVYYPDDVVHSPALHYLPKLAHYSELEEKLLYSNNLATQEIKKLLKSNNIMHMFEENSPRIGFSNSTGEYTFAACEDLYYRKYSLAANKVNVCVPHKNADRMWLAELQTVNTRYDVEAKVMNARLEKSLIRSSSYVYDSSRWFVIDYNLDGKDDFFNMLTFIYSVNDNYYETTRLFEINESPVPGFWEFQPFRGTCDLGPIRDYLYLSTDGNYYYLNDLCNLTKLTSKR